MTKLHPSQYENFYPYFFIVSFVIPSGWRSLDIYMEREIITPMHFVRDVVSSSYKIVDYIHQFSVAKIKTFIVVIPSKLSIF